MTGDGADGGNPTEEITLGHRASIEHCGSQQKLDSLMPVVEPQPNTSGHAHSAIRLYGIDFWLAFLANLLVVTANTLTFRFADFVQSLGGTAADAGFIIGVGTGVSVLLRIWIGRFVDQQGPRLIWILSAAALAVGCLGFMPLRSLGVPIYLIRVIYHCGIGGVFSCSVIHLCTGTPIERRAELIGTLGTSGFLGMMLGPQIGDWIFQSELLAGHTFLAMFAISAAMDLAYLLLVVYLTRNSERPAAHEPPPLGRMLVQYWPGTVVAVAMMMGMALTVPATFLTLFRDVKGLEGIGKFFWCYAPTAIVMRLAGRRWPEQLGRRKSALIGLTVVAMSLFLYVQVETEWDLAWSAIAAGTGQALLFPAVTTLGAESFPERYRATGTTLILSFIDLGALCGAPILGLIIDHAGFNAMFYTAATTVTVTAVAFAISAALRSYRANQIRTDELTEDQVPLPSISE